LDPGWKGLPWLLVIFGMSATKKKKSFITLIAGVLETVQKSAQACLQAGWSILLPTAEERARALSTLIGNQFE